MNGSCWEWVQSMRSLPVAASVGFAKGGWNETNIASPNAGDRHTCPGGLFNASGTNAYAACHAHSPAAGGQEQPRAFDCPYLAPRHYRPHCRTLTHYLNLAYTSAYSLAHSNA
jgi:hypothetical protein